MVFIGLLFFVIVATVAITMASTTKSRLEIQREFISNYRFPSNLSDKLSRKYPHLEQQQIALVLEGLRQYFFVCLNGRAVDGQVVGMPSKAVDEAWHEFILMTGDYMSFCEQAFGRYLHHSPHRPSTPNGLIERQLSRTWQYANTPAITGTHYMLAGVPLLFALDSELKIPDGNSYSEEQLKLFEQKRGCCVFGWRVIALGFLRKRSWHAWRIVFKRCFVWI